MDPRFIPLADALRARLAVIADHAGRDLDPATHLERLKSASEHLMALGTAMAPVLPPRLAHFMERCSYDKALAFMEGRTVEGAH